MTRFILPLALVITTLALALPAQAAPLTRTYVSQAGNDANPCTSIQPCRHFTNAYAVTAANGIITALDPGGYGPLTITTAITINGQGWASITAPASGTGIIVNAGASNQVILTGLTVDGAGAGSTGIEFDTGASLTITDCVVQNFVGGGPTAGVGVLIRPTSGTVNFLISNTTATNNQNVGIYYFPPSGSATVNGVIDRVVAISNAFGVAANTLNASGGSATIAISNSIASANADGLYVQNGVAPLTVSIDNVSASDNNNFGIHAFTTAKVLLGRSVVTGNGTGILNATSPNTFYTYKDNRINLNGTDINGALNTTLVLQ